MGQIEFGPKSVKLIEKLTDAVELLAGVLHQGNANWQTACEQEIEDDTLLCCCICDRDFRAHEEDVVRTKDGGVYCVPCYRTSGLKLIGGNGG